MNRINTFARALVALMLFFGLFASHQARAGLLGSELTFSFISGTYEDSATGLAGSDDLTVTGFFGDDFFVPGFTDNSLTVFLETDFTGETTYGPLVSLVLSGADFLGVEQLTTDVLGLALSSFSITGDMLEISLASTTWVNGNSFTVALALDQATVPVPATLVLLGLGLLGLGWMRR
ncbi:PEP-CTERM sorting domain-containing protein [Kineobactrum salinum]|uniref:PEP-CTERM sorting domain-containing protein n=1 Tax=Kineobactrum salinum TaxID=2708301 RepID=A0A6C0U4L7_9GAMM|nr:PEP-CTERM sorting domain-containing protein [Kineobactrum salinum]QIB66793.1 PEP-CTERM sorting domain-containing protein [Kineobactrum salinum]